MLRVFDGGNDFDMIFTGYTRFWQNGLLFLHDFRALGGKIISRYDTRKNGV